MSFVTIVAEDESFNLKVGDSVFHLRRFTSAQYRQIEKRHTKKYWKRGQQVVEVDEDAVNNDILDYIITGWENIKHPKSREDVPCTIENKIALPSNVKIQINEACDAEDIFTDQKKSELKNF